MDDPFPQPATFDPPKPKSAGGRSWWFWLLLLFGFLGCGFLGCCGVFGYVGYTGFQEIKKMEPYSDPLEQVKAHPQVIEKLGEPMVDSQFPSQFKVDLDNDDGLARFTFDLTGPLGSAEVETHSIRENGKWKLEKLEVTFPDGEVLDLLDDAAAAQPEATDEPTF